MAVTMTDGQLEWLLRAVQGGGGVVAGTAAVVGPMVPCHLGKDKLKRGGRVCFSLIGLLGKA